MYIYIFYIIFIFYVYIYIFFKFNFGKKAQSLSVLFTNFIYKLILRTYINKIFALLNYTCMRNVKQSYCNLRKSQINLDYVNIS